MSDFSNPKLYQPKMSRRESIKRMGSLASVIMIGGVAVACDTQQPETDSPMPVDASSHWPNIELEAITGPGYGPDPLLIQPSAPWPRTLSAAQLDQVAVLSDIICPADERGPAATTVGVPDVIDEWVSAPYSSQQRDRVLVINGLQWLDDEAGRRFSTSFVGASEAQRLNIIDDIAFRSQAENPEFEHAVQFFARLRRLVFGGYFTSPQGTEDIGYMGNVAIAGDYPGPTDEAMQHLNQVIASLGL